MAERVTLGAKIPAVTYDQAFENHKQFWGDFWRRMDIEIEGDPELQQGVRYSIYTVYSNYHGESDRRNVICKLAGEVYNGVNFGYGDLLSSAVHVLNPEIARKLLMTAIIICPEPWRTPNELI